MRKPKPPLEHEVQRAVIALYRVAGCHVYSTSPGRRGGTWSTPGIPDLDVFCPKLGAELIRLNGDWTRWWFAGHWRHETKRPKLGRTSEAQKQFKRVAADCGVIVVVGGVVEAVAHLRALGLVATP